MKSSISTQLRLALDTLPTTSGVYLMMNGKGKIIYIGKAKNLRSRVRSYFQASGHDGRRQFNALVRRIANLDYIATDSEQEALILEAMQIRQHKPRYNILLKDDKKYPYIRITNEPFPRIFATRNVEQDGSRYLGPYSNLRAMYTTLELMHKIFPVRTCDANLPSSKIKLCLEYHIHRCEGPCENLVDSDNYRDSVNRAIRFLKGSNNEVLRELRQRMEEAAEALQFERAARLRDQITALENMRARQKVVLDEEVDRDVVGLARHDDDACCSVLEIREGRLLGQKHHFLAGVMDSSEGEILSAFIRQFYLETDFIPSQLHLRHPAEDADQLVAWLSSKTTSKVELTVPQRGPKAKTLDMAENNAQFRLKERQLKREMQKDRIPQSIYALQRDLDLPELPRRIEGIDISNLHGTDSVGSSVCFVDGRAKRSEYRHFKIKDLDRPDDFASIHQVVERRFRGLQERGEPLPDLLLIDGGKGQLAKACEALSQRGIPQQPVIGLAKRLEEVFLPQQPTPLLLPKTSASLRLLQQLRDEAHRFALDLHRKLRHKRTITSALDHAPGIGAKRRADLLQHFGSVHRIREASIEQIAQVKGLSLKTASQLKAYLENHPPATAAGVRETA